MTEVVGASGSGKTQFCLALVSHIACDYEWNIAYIDTSNAFSAKRIQEIMLKRPEFRNLSPQKADQIKIQSMSKIQRFQAYSVLQLLTILGSMREELIAKRDLFWQRLRVVVIDSVGGLLVPILGGKLYRGHHFMFTLARAIKSLASEFKIAFITTNHTVGHSYSAANERPALGEQWTFYADTRLNLSLVEQKCVSKVQGRRNSDGKVKEGAAFPEGVVQIVKSSKSAIGITAPYFISAAGLCCNPI